MTRDNDWVYEFEPFRLDPRERLLLKHGEPVAIENAPFDLLCVFASEAGRLLSREALLQSVWRDTHVDPNTLNVTVSTLRRVLCDTPAEHRYIQTVPKGGYRFVAPVTVLYRDAPPAPAVRKVPSRSQRWSFPQLGVFGAAIVSVSVTAWLLFPAAGGSEQPQPFPLTAYMGQESSPAVSPDGTQVAFSWLQPGEDRDIYLLRIGDQGPPLRLTTTPDHDDAPSWSPNGRQIAFIRNPGESGAIFVVDSSGGAERRITSTKGHSLAWTRDGSMLVFNDVDSGKELSALYVLSTDSGARRQLTSPAAEPGHGDFGPAVSPDGKVIAFTRRLTYDNSDLYIVPIDGGQPKQVTSDRRRLAGVAWTPDGKQLVFSSGRSGSFRLWRTGAYSLSQPRLLDTVPENVLHPSLPSSLAVPPWPLAYERVERDYNIWMIDRQSAQAVGYAATGRISSTIRSDQSPRISPEGNRIALTSDRSGFFELWICDFPRGRNCVRQTSFQGAHVGSPSWSPDGRVLVCDARVNGNADIYLIGTGASESKRLTSDPSVESRPSWSRDGRWVYFRSDRTGRHQIWKVPAEGGDAVQVTTDGGFEAFESNDGAELYFIRSRSSSGLWSRGINSGSEVETRELSGVTGSAWAVSKGGIYWLDSTAIWSKHKNFIRFFDLTTRAVTTVGEVHAWLIPTATGFSVSEDERYLVWSQLDRDITDLMLVAKFR